MHMIWRTLWIFLTKRFSKRAELDHVTEYTMRVLPTDLDLLFHVNNGIYFSLMDFGRWDMIFRNGVYDACMKRGWYSVVAAETIKFKKSLRLWDKFTLQTQLVSHDEKNIFIQQEFICRGELMATGLVRIRVLRRTGGTVPTEEVFRELKTTVKIKKAELGEDWQALESKHLV